MFSWITIKIRVFLLLLGIVCALTCHLAAGEWASLDWGEQRPGRDVHGDPLPKNAIARFGTIRLRQIEEAILVTFSPDGKYIASGTNSCDVRLWEVSTGKEFAHVYFPGGREANQRLLFSPDGLYLSYVSENVIKIWDVSKKWNLSINFSIAPIVFSSDSKLVVGIIDRGLVIFDLKNQVIKRRLRRIEHFLHALAFSPDGKLVAASEGKSPPWKSPNTIRLWDAHSGNQISEWVAHHRAIDSLCFSRDNKVLASGGIGGVHLWDVASNRRLATLEDDAAIVAFSPHGKLLAVSGWTKKVNLSNEIHLWDTATHELVRSIRAGSSSVRSFAFSPDGKKIVTGGGEHAIRLWDVETGRQLLPRSGHAHTIFSIQFARDGNTLASYGGDLTVRLWDLEREKEQRRFLLGNRGSVCEGAAGTVPTSALAFSPSGKTVAAIGIPREGDVESPVPIWDVKSGDRVAVIQVPRLKKTFYRPRAIALSSDGQVLATVDAGNIQLWSSTSARQFRTLFGDRDRPFNCVAFAPVGRTIATADYSRRIGLWDWTNGRLIHAFPTTKYGATHLTFSPAGHMLASSWYTEGHLGVVDNIIRLWEPETGSLIRIVDVHHGSVSCVAFSPNGRVLASADPINHTIRIWDVYTGKELAKFTGHRGPVYCVAFSPDGKIVASGSADTTILLWDVSKIQPEQPPAIAQGELPKELARLWDEMQAREGEKGYKAVWQLLGAGDGVIAFLNRKLQPVPAPDTERVQQWIADLDSDDFAKRQAATEQLTKLRELAESALRQALKGKPSLEAGKRLESLLSEIAERTISDTELRQFRALHALELIGSPAACDLLKKLAGGAPGARLTRDAKLALQRLQRRANKP